MLEEDEALIEVAGLLREDGYRFTTVTPLTQQRVNSRHSNNYATNLAGVFGWSRVFSQDLLSVRLLALMRAANVLEPVSDGYCRSRVRLSTLGQHIYVHSAYPTVEADAVFFGPDTVRFVHAIERHLTGRKTPVIRAADIGCGAGPGAIRISASAHGAEVLMLDINALALRYARVNAAINRVSAQPVLSDILGSTNGTFDLIVSNPPYLIDAKERAYRHGGGRFGEGLSLQILKQSMARLSDGGTFLLYTGSAIGGGVDGFKTSCRDFLETCNCRWSYEELDPDVFGEELEMPAYATVERIAAVILTVDTRSSDEAV
jgi:methylase of polypeptide subunit release factors